MDVVEVVRIAGRLTDAQCRLLLALHAREFRDWGAPGMPGNSRTAMHIEFLTVAGKPTYMRRLNALGKRVRAHLLNL